ncbi:protein FLOURY 1-like [Senna tora]|uniref:Protein FLOURY 1-like n=1 Tax=Senna tora TaxID=362788 RepID=A0A834XER1_9FABA|nr:protein FLOURY 1-like [Senna tora]
MQILGRYCVFISVYSVLSLYQRALRVSAILTQLSYAGCGFLLRGSFLPVLNILGMLLIFVLCFKILGFGWLSKGLMRYLYELQVCDSKIGHFKCGSLESLQNSNSLNNNNSPSSTENVSYNGDGDDNSDVLEQEEDGEGEVLDEDKVFDEMTLRKLVKIERRRANDAYAELEMEREASASAADEAIAMIQRHQSEKSLVDLEAKQFRRVAEQAQSYDQEVVESLRSIIRRNEYQISLLEHQKILYREKLKQYMGEDEMEQFEDLASTEGCYTEMTPLKFSSNLSLQDDTRELHIFALGFIGIVLTISNASSIFPDLPRSYKASMITSRQNSKEGDGIWLHSSVFHFTK